MASVATAAGPGSCPPVAVVRGVQGLNGPNDLVVARPAAAPATGAPLVVAFAGDMSALEADMLASNFPTVPPVRARFPPPAAAATPTDHVPQSH